MRLWLRRQNQLDGGELRQLQMGRVRRCGHASAGRSPSTEGVLVLQARQTAAGGEVPRAQGCKNGASGERVCRSSQLTFQPLNYNVFSCCL